MVVPYKEFGEVSGEVELDTSDASLLSFIEPLVTPVVNPSFSLFFCFILRFWNQIFTWVSFSSSVAAISTRLARVKYLLKWNSFSSSVSCLVVKLVLMVFCWEVNP